MTELSHPNGDGTWLVTGASGLLGANAMKILGARHPVVGVARRPVRDPGLGIESLDLTSPGAARELLRRVRPSVVLHTAAIASIEVCESDPALARRLNVDVTAELAAEAHAVGAAFVAISTDAVFEGRDGGPHREDDETAPVTVYAATKLAGERAALDAHPEALVARVNFTGWSPSGSRGLAEFFYGRLSRSEQTAGFADVEVSTLDVGLLVTTLEDLVARGAHGVLHVVSSEPTTKLDYGRRLAEVFGFDPALVLADESTRHLAVARGQHLALDTSRAAELLGRPLPTQADGLAALRAARDAGWPEQLAPYAPQEGTVFHHENR